MISDSSSLGFQSWSQSAQERLERFGNEWDQGKQPKIVDYLKDKEDWEQQFPEYLKREVECRRRLGEVPNIEEYLKRYEEDSERVKMAFFETLLPGNYQLTRVLGSGGMGLVFEAEERNARRKVAIKVMKPQLADEKIYRERFIREARAAANLHHKHIVEIYYVGEENGTPYYVMPLLLGETLKDRLGRNFSFPVAEIIRVSFEVAEGLAIAHGKGFIHRDIKPGNLWLDSTDNDCVKILDFGLVRTDPVGKELTGPGDKLGTPEYMAPEQADCKVVDFTADLFCLGCVMYYMASGCRPFQNLDRAPPPPLNELGPDLPPALVTLIHQLIKKEPSQRPQSASEVCERLRSMRPIASPLKEGGGPDTQEAPTELLAQGIDAQLIFSVERLKPELGIKIRRRISGEVAAPEVFLVECQVKGERRLAVLKVVSKEQANAETRGHAAALNSWLGVLVPQHLELLGEVPGTQKIAVLSVLPPERSEDCQTLEDVLKDSFNYGAEHVLRAMAYKYRQHAKDQWSQALRRSLRDLFQLPIKDTLGDLWLTAWQECNFPGPECAGFIFDDTIERWPNPVAFLMRNELWKEHESVQVSVPWIQSHGELNAHTVLCPSHHRAFVNGIIQTFEPDKLVKTVSLINIQSTRSAPVTFDLCFLTSGLDSLLPGFDNRAKRDLTLKTYRAALEEVLGNQAHASVPSQGFQFTKCMSEALAQLRYAQEAMKGDIDKSFLATLAGASLFQAVKLATGHTRNNDGDRLAALRRFLLSAMALHQLLAPTLRLPGEDFRLGMGLQLGGTKTWTQGSKAIGELLESLAGRKNLLLVLGREWNAAIGLPSESDLAKAKAQGASALAPFLNWEPPPSLYSKMQLMGGLPLAGVLDWSVFRYPRDALTKALPNLVRVVGDETTQDWTDSSACFYFHLCGTLDDLPTVALTGPERSKSRQKLRPRLEAFAKKRGPNMTVLYLGLSESDLRETHNFVHEIWQESLRAVYIGQPPPPLEEYFKEWNLESVSGTVDDFMLATADFARPSLVVSHDNPHRTIQVANMARDEETRELISAPGNVLSVDIPQEDYQAISRAGHLLLMEDVEQYKVFERNPRDFFIGHRVTFSEVHTGVPVERDSFALYLETIRDKLKEKRPQLLALPSQPGAGASTALRWLAYHTAYQFNVPTLVLTRGGNVAFEAIERLYHLVGRSFIVVADTADVPADDQLGLHTRCGPPRYPVLFVVSRRVFQSTGGTSDMPFLKMTLSSREKIGLLERFDRFCPGTSLEGLIKSPTDSLFFLTLEAFGGEHIRVDNFVTDLMKTAIQSHPFLLAAVAFFSRYAHRACSVDFLQLLTGERGDLEAELRKFDQLLILAEKDSWSCRHEELSRAILQFQLTGTVATPADAKSHPWRFRLADWACQLIEKCNEGEPGADIAADYIWAVLNPQLEGYRTPKGEKLGFCRLMQGADGIPEKVMKEKVYQVATEQFPRHVFILSHFGKFLSEDEGKFSDAEAYLERARQIEPSNEAVLHMLGKRFYDELKDLSQRNPPRDRQPDLQDHISTLAESAHNWFDKAREMDPGSEYSYTTAIQLDILLVEDEFKRLGVKAGDANALLEKNISSHLTHADQIVEDGLRYIDPASRPVFAQARDRLFRLRGDLDQAIQCFEKHVAKLSGPHRLTAQVQLTRYYLERGEKWFLEGEVKKAYKDFEAGQSHIGAALEDPANRYNNIKLWYQCARHMKHWRRQDFLEKLHEMHNQKPTLDSAFLLMCLYFADAVETHSLPSWRKYEEFQVESDRRSTNLSVRTRIREWLVEVDRTRGGKQEKELVIYPHHLMFRSEGDEDHAERVIRDKLLKRVTGAIYRVRSATAASLKLEPMGFEVFFRPRITVPGDDRRYYPSDEGKRVTCAVMFTYEKPIAYDVTKV